MNIIYVFNDSLRFDQTLSGGAPIWAGIIASTDRNMCTLNAMQPSHVSPAPIGSQHPWSFMQGINDFSNQTLRQKFTALHPVAKRRRPPWLALHLFPDVIELQQCHAAFMHSLQYQPHSLRRWEQEEKKKKAKFENCFEPMDGGDTG